MKKFDFLPFLYWNMTSCQSYLLAWTLLLKNGCKFSSKWRKSLTWNVAHCNRSAAHPKGMAIAIAGLITSIRSGKMDGTERGVSLKKMRTLWPKQLRVASSLKNSPSSLSTRRWP